MCPGCGREFISLKIHLTKASGPCAEFRVQQLMASTPGLPHQTSPPTLINADHVPNDIPNTTPVESVPLQDNEVI
jgi:hypothetical protein